MNTVEINSLKKYSEFTTTFRIKKANDAWKEVCIQASRTEIESDEECVVTPAFRLWKLLKKRVLQVDQLLKAWIPEKIIKNLEN